MILVRAAVALVSVAGLVGCGGGSSPTGPSAPPPVAGSPPAPTPEPSTPAPTPTPPAPSPAPAPTPPPDAVLRTASIRGANGHAASGTARILREDGRHVLELGSDFRIDGGVNEVYLARRDDGVSGSDRNLGDLRSLSGRQRYSLADDGGDYRYVIIWCRPFQIPIGRGELR